MDVSIIEIVVYGIICYAGVLGLIISSFKENSPAGTKSQSATRVIWLIPSIICAFMLANAGADIFLDSETKTVTQDFEALDSTDSIVILNSTTTTTTENKITLIQPVWVTLHFLFFIVLLIYVLFNILSGFTRH